MLYCSVRIVFILSLCWSSCCCEERCRLDFCSSRCTRCPNPRSALGKWFRAHRFGVRSDWSALVINFTPSEASGSPLYFSDSFTSFIYFKSTLKSQISTKQTNIFPKTNSKNSFLLQSSYICMIFELLNESQWLHLHIIYYSMGQQETR